MVSIKNLSVATATLILGFSSKALGDTSELTTDFVVRAEGAESGVTDQFALRSVHEDLLTRSDGALVDLEARDFEDEIEERNVDDLEERAPLSIHRLQYKCGWNGCEKAYGTLNHLNAHVTMQSHGPKRTSEEFKEIRKVWRARKKVRIPSRRPPGRGRRSVDDELEERDFDDLKERDLEVRIIPPNYKDPLAKIRKARLRGSRRVRSVDEYLEARSPRRRRGGRRGGRRPPQAQDE